MDNTRKSSRQTIRELREERGWTRRYLSVILDVTEGTIRYWEVNGVEPKIAQQKRIIEAFGVRWEDIEWPDKAKKYAPAA